MRTLLGFILGVILTIAGAYAYDSATGRAPNGLLSSAAGGQAPAEAQEVPLARSRRHRHSGAGRDGHAQGVRHPGVLHPFRIDGEHLAAG